MQPQEKAPRPALWCIHHRLGPGQQGVLCWVQDRADAATIAQALCYTYGGEAIIVSPAGEPFTFDVGGDAGD